VYGSGYRGVAPYHPYYYRPSYYRPYGYYPHAYGYYGYPYGYGGFGINFGFSFGYPYPYPYAYAYPYASPYGVYAGAPYAYGGAPYPAAYGAVGVQTYGGIRIDVPQRDAEVYVDGNFAGTIEQNNGTVNLEAGTHHIEVHAPGFAPAAFDISVVPGRTITYRTALRPERP